VFTDALWSIADKGLERETGAQACSIIENVARHVQLPARKDVPSA
jgi:hypothetical protein